MAAVLGLIIGVVVGLFVKPDIPIWLQPYLPIMVVAALDALLGAARAYFERSFSDKVFVMSSPRHSWCSWATNLVRGRNSPPLSSSCLASASSPTSRQSAVSSSRGEYGRSEWAREQTDSVSRDAS